MATWLVRAGKTGSRENFALEKGFAVIGFDEVGDLSDVRSKDQLRERLTAAIKTSENAVKNYTNQVWAFIDGIQRGDTVALPLKSSASVALGTVVGDYEFDPDAPVGSRHRRAVEWVQEGVPRTSFGQDILYSLGAFMTVCRIKRNDADSRIAALMAGRPDPGMGSRLTTGSVNVTDGEPDTDDAEALDLERYGRDRITSIIAKNFAGHELTALIDAILQAQGYHTIVSPAGPDGGVDILAGAAPLGFGEPRICVQVKTGEADAPMLRDLLGTMHSHDATHGLFVAWGGFKRTVREEERRTFFQIRLWDSDDVITELIESYDRLPAAIRDAIPLTQVWTVVEDDA